MYPVPHEESSNTRIGLLILLYDYAVKYNIGIAHLWISQPICRDGKGKGTDQVSQTLRNTKFSGIPPFLE